MLVYFSGTSIVDDVDPDFFKIVQGRPIKDKTSIRGYVQDLRDCFMTRFKIGLYEDNILLLDEKYLQEKKLISKVKQMLYEQERNFEIFLKEDYEKSAELLAAAEKEIELSKEKFQKVTCLKKQLKEIEAEVLVLEEKWNSARMFQKFLYLTAPSEWRKVNDPDYQRTDISATVSDPCLFNRWVYTNIYGYIQNYNLIIE